MLKEPNHETPGYRLARDMYRHVQPYTNGNIGYNGNNWYFFVRKNLTKIEEGYHYIYGYQLYIWLALGVVKIKECSPVLGDTVVSVSAKLTQQGALPLVW